jgi:hypothetical protein
MNFSEIEEQVGVYHEDLDLIKIEGVSIEGYETSEEEVEEEENIDSFGPLEDVATFTKQST